MTVLMFTALVWQVVDFLRELAAWRVNRSAILTQVTAWAGGIALVLLGAHAKVVAAVVLPGTSLALGKLDAGSIILVGMMVASVASSAVDVKQALDNTDSAAKPPLVADVPVAVVADPIPPAAPPAARARRARKA